MNLTSTWTRITLVLLLSVLMGSVGAMRLTAEDCYGECTQACDQGLAECDAFCGDDPACYRDCMAAYNDCYQMCVGCSNH